MSPNDQPPSDPVQPPPSLSMPPDQIPPPSDTAFAAKRNISEASKVVAIIIIVLAAALIAGIVIPVINATRDTGRRRSRCPSNLRQIGQGLQLYANDYKSFPRTYYDPTLVSTFAPNFAGGARSSPSSNPFLPQPLGSVGTNNVLAAMFLLVRTTDLNPEVFICPHSNQEKDTFTTANGTCLTFKDVSNFTSANNISYSFANPYPTSQGVGAGGTSPINLGYKWSPNVTADFGIAGDRNDGFTTSANAGKVAILKSDSTQADQRFANSRNHEQDGQNVLFNDGHVDWGQSQWLGANKDGIYTAAKTGKTGSSGTDGQLSPAASKDTVTADPQIDLDTILLPKF